MGTTLLYWGVDRWSLTFVPGCCSWAGEGFQASCVSRFICASSAWRQVEASEGWVVIIYDANATNTWCTWARTTVPAACCVTSTSGCVFNEFISVFTEQRRNLLLQPTRNVFIASLKTETEVSNHCSACATAQPTGKLLKVQLNHCALIPISQSENLYDNTYWSSWSY